jgi:NADH-quinone oxidoreductase subunit N
VIETPSVDWFAISPALALLGAAGVALLGAVFVPRAWARALGAFSAAGGFAGAAVAAALLYAWSEDPEGVVADAAIRDRWGALAMLVICVAGLFAVAVSYSERMADDHVGEYYAVLAAAGAGMCFFVQANNLMSLFLGLEWFSIALYILCAIDDRFPGLEAGLKYLIIGSFGSAALLFGSALVYGATGELEFGAIATRAESDDGLLLAGLAMMLAGLGFKASAAPFHMWTPDVYQGAATPVTAFMSAATKVAALALTFRVLTVAFPNQDELWTVAIAVIACASLAIGNLAALVQRDVKRILAYSSVAHAGFMLIAVAAANEAGGKALMYYLIPYAAASLGAFAVVAARERELGEAVTLENLGGFGWERPLLGAAMWIFMLAFAGLPLTGGFVGKFYLFVAAYERDWIWLIIVGVAATAVSLYYYLAIIRALYLRAPEELALAPAGGSPPPERMLGLAVALCVVVVVGSFFAVEPLIDLAEDATAALPL